MSFEATLCECASCGYAEEMDAQEWAGTMGFCPSCGGSDFQFVGEMDADEETVTDAVISDAAGVEWCGSCDDYTVRDEEGVCTECWGLW